jgi:hypothetical protein
MPRNPNANEITEFIIKEIMVTCSKIERAFDEVYSQVNKLGPSFLDFVKTQNLERVYQKIKKTTFSTV